MGFLDSLFSSTSSKEEVPSYLRKSYEKFGLDPDKEMKGQYPNKGKKCIVLSAAKYIMADISVLNAIIYWSNGIKRINQK